MGKLRALVLIGICCVLIGVSYLTTLFAAMALWNSGLNPLFRLGIGVDPASAMFFAIPLIVVPYLVGGVFLGLLDDARYALASGLITTLGERLLILAAAAVVLRRFRSLTPTGEVFYVEGGPDLIRSIRSEALPYFGWGYILLGAPASILILYLTARGIAALRRRPERVDRGQGSLS